MFPPNSESDMNYMICICNVRMSILMRVYTHGGVGHTDSESALHFLLEKHQVFLVHRTGFEQFINKYNYVTVDTDSQWKMV